MAFSMLGMPPRTDTGIGPPGVVRYSRSVFDGDTAAMRGASSGVRRTLDMTNRAL